jgi:TusA-related sulfurtransferase
MEPFRSEIRNTPNGPTIKIYLTDETLDMKIKHHLESFSEIDFIEIRETVAQNRSDEGLTIFLKDGMDINKMKSSIDSSLWWYFEEDLVD